MCTISNLKEIDVLSYRPVHVLHKESGPAQADPSLPGTAAHMLSYSLCCCFEREQQSGLEQGFWEKHRSPPKIGGFFIFECGRCFSGS